MSTNIIDYESIHTQSAYEIELRVRAREEQRYMLGEDLGKEEAGRVKRTSNPVKAQWAGILSSSKVFLQAMVHSTNQGASHPR